MPEVKLTRRQFFQVTGAGLGASSMTVMGLAHAKGFAPWADEFPAKLSEVV